MLSEYQQILTSLQGYLAIFEKPLPEQHQFFNHNHTKVIDEIERYEKILDQNEPPLDVNNPYLEKVKEQKEFIIRLAKGYYKNPLNNGKSDNVKEQNKNKIPPNITAFKYLLDHVIERYKYKISILEEEKKNQKNTKQQKSIQEQFQKARCASTSLIHLSEAKKQEILLEISNALQKNCADIIKHNQKDLAKMADDDPKKDRLLLNTERIMAISEAVKNISQLPSPIEQIYLEKELANGLKLKKIAVPLGVVGVIYESRPNVTIDIAALCIKSGNAVLLRGGKEAFNSNTYLVDLIREVLAKHQVDTNIVQLFPIEREYIQDFITANKYIDILIPRGSKQLINFVRDQATIPVIETGAGVCHIYVHQEADLEMAVTIVANAKHQRPSVCNALDTVLLDQEIAKAFLEKLVPIFTSKKTGIWADKTSHEILSAHHYPHLNLASEEDFGKEYLSNNCSIKVITDFSVALEHIAMYSSKHSEAIISKNEKICQQFLKEVDAAAVYSNASIRFTDGEVFELGAEIGISTQKLHARGPFALEKLMTEKWLIIGAGQVR